jgi:hypothetical protein
LTVCVGPGVAEKDRGLTITLDAPYEACPGDTITFVMTLTNDDVQRAWVEASLIVHGRDVSEPAIIFEDIISVPANSGAGGPGDPPAVVIEIEYAVPVPAGEHLARSWALRGQASAEDSSESGHERTSDTEKTWVLAATDPQCGPTPAPLGR